MAKTNPGYYRQQRLPWIRMFGIVLQNVAHGVDVFSHRLVGDVLTRQYRALKKARILARNEAGRHGLKNR